MHVCVSVCEYTRVCISVYVHACVSMCVCVYLCLCACVCICVRVCVWCMHVCAHVYMHGCSCVCMCISLCVCAHVSPVAPSDLHTQAADLHTPPLEAQDHRLWLGWISVEKRPPCAFAELRAWCLVPASSGWLLGPSFILLCP